jgi:hypothetical protein
VVDDLVTEGIENVVMQVPASMLGASAVRSGWMRKEGKGNKAFKRRWFVLWQEPEADAGTHTLGLVPCLAPHVIVTLCEFNTGRSLSACKRLLT